MITPAAPVQAALPSPTARLFPSGRFRVGCNYWASHAGAHMWSDWQPEVVAQDLAQLARAGLTLVRIFPLWPDFQPLTRLSANDGAWFEYRHGEEPLPDDEIGQAGVDVRMLERFRWVADEAARHGLQLIVGLVTGWMSGRLFAPPAFCQVNVLTDPEALRWQARFVRCFVRTLGDHPAIAAWDLGNECNAMGEASAPQSWLWTHALAAAIRAADPGRPIISGMHSLAASPRAPWAARDQGELTDVLTTHPYPLWTPYCDQDPLTSLRPQLHATAESLYYAGLGGKPCFAEEMGSMGPFIASDQVTPHFLRPSLYSLWAHDCRAMLWWCAYDQNELSRAPYDWVAVEQQLGLFRADRTPKPAVEVLTAFSRTLAGLPFTTLPPRLVDGACLLTEGQEHWPVAYTAFTLAKQAGADLTFHWFDGPLPEASVYLLPGLCGGKALIRRRWLALLERIHAGATLYVSLDTVLLADLEPVFGVSVTTRQRRAEPGQFRHGDHLLPTAGEFQLNLEATRAVVHAREADGNPTFVECAYGAGRVFLLTQALERVIGQKPGALERGRYAEAWRVYARVFSAGPRRRAWQKTNLELGVTEHPQDASTRIVVLVNHANRTLLEPVQLTSGWRLDQVLVGSPPGPDGLTIPVAEAAIVRLVRHDAPPSVHQDR